MKRITTLLIACFAILALFSCEKVQSAQLPEPQKEEEKQPEDNNQNNNDGNGAVEMLTPTSKTLVVYYSYTGNCRAIVASLTEQIEADVLEILPAEEGLKYEADNYKIGSALITAIREKPDDASSYPGIKPVNRDASAYETIYIVTPLWWGNMAAIMQSYLFQNGAKMEGKAIGLIVSSHSSGISDVVKDAKRLVPKGNFLEESLWINASNHEKRTELIKDWMTPKPANDAMTINITSGGKTITATLADNSSGKAFAEKLREGSVTIEMHDYGGFEKVGALDFSLVQNDEQITTVPGDIILYQGDNVCLYYDTNTWNFTRLGKMNDVTQDQIKAFLKAGDGNISVTFSLKQ